jgi:two-component system LytT family response regulator
MKIRTLLVDDEIAALNTLSGMLHDYCPEVKVVASARTVDEAVQAAAQWKPELVFLDIRMSPFGSGFDFLERSWKKGSFGVIFTTAFPEYAIKAINAVQPWSYLVKPYTVNNLKEAVEIAAEKLSSADHQSIVIPDSRKGNQVLRVRDILYCEADGSTTDIFLLRNNKVEKITASRLLGDLEEELPEWLFCRTHNSFLVNMRHILRWERTGRNGLVYLPEGKCVSISVLKMEHFVERFEVFLKG